MATARLVGDLITLDVAHRENDLAKMTPGMRYHPRGDEHSPRPHFVFPLAWASCVALRGVFKENLTVDPELSAWARNELETRIQPALALRDVLELPTDHPLTERFAAWDSPTQSLLRDRRARPRRRGPRIHLRRTGRVRPPLHHHPRATLARRPEVGRRPRVLRCCLRRRSRSPEGRRSSTWRARHGCRTGRRERA